MGESSSILVVFAKFIEGHPRYESRDDASHCESESSD